MPDLYPWQAAEVDHHALTPKRAIFASPRLGKTLAAIESLRRAVDAHGYDRGLILAPKVVCPHWATQLEAAGFSVVRGYAKPSADLKVILANRPAGLLVLNYDKLGPVINAMLRWRAQAVIADESHYIKSPTSNRSKATRKVAMQAKWVRLLTGTPTPNHYGDLWSQMVCVSADRWGTWPAFKNEFLIMDSFFPSRVVGHVNVDRLQSKLVADAAFVRREDVFGPDSYQTIVREIDLPEKAYTHYVRLARDWILDAQDDGEGVIRADHVLKRLVRLQQMASGYMVDDEGGVHEIHSCKLDAVAADLSEIVAADEKAIIFHRFRWEAQKYLEIAKSLTDKVWVINGDTTAAQRERVVEEFRRTKHEGIVVVQTQAGGVGISFAEATHALFVSQSFAYADEQQARDRIYKRGASRCVTYYRCVGTVDEYIGDALDNKQNIHDSVRHADREAMAFGRFRTPRRKASI